MTHRWFLYLVFVFLLGAICTREALRYDFLIAEKVIAPTPPGPVPNEHLDLCGPCLNNRPASTSGPARRLRGQRCLFSQGAGCSGTELGVAVVSSQPNPSSSSLSLFSLFLQVSLVGFLFLLGLYVSSLASCMGGLYGAPRILQCIAQERVIPALAFLGRAVGA